MLDWSLAPEYAAAFVFGYLCGSIPFGVLLTRLAGVPDVRSIGSGNIGATNVLRTGRKALAAATLLGDMLKGTVAVLVTGYFLGRDAAMFAALGAFLGHLFPVWLKFKRRQGRRDLYRSPSRLGLARRDRLLRDLARDRRALSLFVARRLDRRCADPGLSLVARTRTGSGAVRLAVGPALDHAPRQHRAPSQRQRKQDRLRLSVFFHPLNLRFRGMLAGKRGTCRLGALGAK